MISGARQIVRLAAIFLAMSAALAFGASGAQAASINVNSAFPYITGNDGWGLSGDASANFLVYEPTVNVYAYKLPYSFGDPIVSNGTGNVEAFTGDWSLTMHNLGTTHILPEGKYRLDMIQDPLLPYKTGGMASIGADAVIYVDRTGPQTSINSVVPNPTASTNANFTFSANDFNAAFSETGSGVASFQCSKDGGAWFTCGNDDAFASIGEITSVAPEGIRNFRVRAIDRLGNIGDPASFDWLVDLTDPEIHLPAISQDANQNVVPAYVLGENPPASGTCSDPLAGSPAGASGIRSCVVDPVSTSQLGNFSRAASAEDKVGHTASTHGAYRVVPPRYRDLVAQDDPIAWYRLDDPLGSSTLIDSSGHNHNGDAKNRLVLDRAPALACHQVVRPNGCEVAHDIRGRAAYFDGKGAQGRVDGIVAPAGGFTLEAWVRPLDGGKMMIAQHGGSGALWIDGGKVSFRSSFDNPITGGPALIPGEWAYVAGTWANGVGRLYVNGALVASGSMPHPPSGISTFYLGYGDQAPWLHGDLDEVAYYDHALPAGRIGMRNAVGRYIETPSAPGGPDTTRPDVEIKYPQKNALYVRTKAPKAAFTCSDPDGDVDIASCEADVDGTPINFGAPLPDSPGAHYLRVVAKSQSGLTTVDIHDYKITSFDQVVLKDQPEAYFRFDESSGSGVLVDQTASHNGAFKNDNAPGGTGISGDGSATRAFFGKGGYAFVNGIPASQTGSTLEAWVKPDDAGDMAILEHGGAGALFIRGGKVVFRHVGSEIESPLGAAPVGQTTQVVGVWDGVNMILYVNGVEVASKEAPGQPSGSSTLYLGLANVGLASPWLRGSLDEVSVYSHALEAGQVDQHFRADPPPPAEDNPSSHDPDQPAMDDHVVDDPDQPVGDDPDQSSTDDPVGSVEAESGGSSPKSGVKSNSKARRSALKKCQRMSNRSKRNRCLRHVRNRF